MATNLSRRPLTDALIAQLQTTGHHVGDGIIPEQSGWDGDPDAPTSTFRSYVVLTALTASSSSGDLQDSQADWKIPYMLQSYGVRRDQAEWMADTARLTLAALQQSILTLGADSYKIQQVEVLTLGGINRIDTTDPASFGQQDTIAIWLGKEYS